MAARVVDLYLHGIAPRARRSAARPGRRVGRRQGRVA
jgi:hypothetical protein